MKFYRIEISKRGMKVELQQKSPISCRLFTDQNHAPACDLEDGIFCIIVIYSNEHNLNNAIQYLQEYYNLKMNELIVENQLKIKNAECEISMAKKLIDHAKEPFYINTPEDMQRFNERKSPLYT